MHLYQSDYEQYLADRGVKLMPSIQQAIAQIITETQWDDPVTGSDFNNIAVMAMIEADNTNDLAVRGMYLEAALEALEQAYNYPLGAVHWAMIKVLLGESGSAQNQAFTSLLNNTINNILLRSLSIRRPEPAEGINKYTTPTPSKILQFPIRHS